MRLRTMLAAVLLQEGAREQAREIARPLCNAGPGSQVPDMLEKLALCAD